MPGRVIQAMRRAEVVNPVHAARRDRQARAATTAAIRRRRCSRCSIPSRTSAFNDHYLEVDYDLSQVLFVTTANSLPAIPEPLRDRMEIIRLAGLPRPGEARDRAAVPACRGSSAQHGIDADDRDVSTPDVIPTIVHAYTREAGVRELERRIGAMARKLARARSERRSAYAPTAGDAPPEHDTVQASRPARAARRGAVRSVDDTSLEDKVGVATGLAYTSVGGEVLEIEVSVVPGRGKLQLTGTLGDVMKESASAALSYARARAARARPRARVPSDARPARAHPGRRHAEGRPVARASRSRRAIVSALTGVPVRGDVAMTGEITLRGRVLPIGGLKEKTVAAHRNRIAHVIIPQAERARARGAAGGGARGDPVPSGANDGRRARAGARAAPAAPCGAVAATSRGRRSGRRTDDRHGATTRSSSARSSSSGGMASAGRLAAARRRCPRWRSPGARTSGSRRCSTASCGGRRSRA